MDLPAGLPTLAGPASGATPAGLLAPSGAVTGANGPLRALLDAGLPLQRMLHEAAVDPVVAGGERWWRLLRTPATPAGSTLVELHEVTDLVLATRRLEQWLAAEHQVQHDHAESQRVAELQLAVLGEHQEALHASQQRWRALVEHLPAVVYLAAGNVGGLAGLVEYVSPAVESLLGRPAWTWLGARGAWADTLHEEDRGRVLDAVAEPLRAGVPRVLDYRLLAADGRVVWVHEEARLVEDGSGASTVTQGILVDVTSEKAAGERDRRREQERRLSQRLEAVGQLAAGIAHEINTPVQFVGDSIAFLAEGVDDVLALVDEQRRLLEADAGPAACAAAGERAEAIDLDYLRERMPAAADRARDGVDRVARIVRAMKGFGRPPAAELRPADLSEAIENTLVVSRSAWSDVADVSCELRLEVPVICSVGDLSQVLLNLVVNAAQAIAEQPRSRRGTITITTERDGDDAHLAVRDDGPGIAPAILPRIFDPFFTTKEVGVGTGQGLSISYQIVTEMHGGSLVAEPDPAGGTTMHVRIPLAGPGR